jgi:hypothetical protein
MTQEISPLPRTSFSIPTRRRSSSSYEMAASGDQGARIAVLVGAQMYDLDGNLLGKLPAGAGSLPISFKNLLEGKRGKRHPRWNLRKSPRNDH